MRNDEMDMMVMMKKCMKGCRMCAVIQIAFGAVLFLLGYLLEAEVVRVLWLVLTGFVAFIGILCSLWSALSLNEHGIAVLPL